MRKVLAAHGPRDVYIGTSAWLSPLDLPKRSDTEAPQPVLIDHLVVFDIDERPFSYRRLERARKIAHRLLAWLERNENLTLLCISYSGGKGFHLILRDNDRTLFSIPSPREREEAIQAARQALLDRVVANGFPVDKTVTADTRRIIRLPGSLHGTTGWACTQLTREQLGQPLKQWVATLPRHRYAKKNTLLALQSRDLRPEHSEAMVLAGSAQESIHQRSRSRPVANHDDVSSQHTSGRDQAPKRLSRLDTASMATRPDSSSG